MHAMLNIYIHCPKLSQSTNPEDILLYIKKTLAKEYPSMDLDALLVETDLVHFGIESIVILSLLAEIEREFKIAISLDALEACQYKISAVTIAEAYDEKS